MLQTSHSAGGVDHGGDALVWGRMYVGNLCLFLSILLCTQNCFEIFYTKKKEKKKKKEP